MIQHCTILFSSNWAPIFFLFSNALGMLFPLWDSNEYVPIRKRHWMRWKLWCFSFQVVSKHLSLPCVFSSVKAPEERKAKTRLWTEQAGLYCTRCKYSGYFLGCKCSVAGTISLPVCTVATTLQTQSLHGKPECLKPGFLPACCIKPGTRFTSARVKPRQGSSGA